MTYILKASEWNFKEDPSKIDPFRLFSDDFKNRLGLKAENLYVDLRRLDPGQFSAPYHFHRNAEELFVILTGTLMLRSFHGFQRLQAGDLAFFEKGEKGAHQFYNDSDQASIYLDIRTFVGYDVCEYLDSGKILFAPSMEIFRKDQLHTYFEGEPDPWEFWKEEIDPK